MAEIRNLQRSKDLTLIGLTQADIASRGVVAVGYCKEELLPPYLDVDHERRAVEILEYVKRNIKSMTLAVTLDIADAPFLLFFSNTKVIQVVGGLADCCIPTAVEAITRTGLYAYVDSRLTFALKSSYADFTLGRMVMRDVLSYPDRRCFIVGRERFIYYREDRVLPSNP